jgi:16S rRNA G966 N2-methylase RsmD
MNAWEIAARELSNELNIQIIGRSRKQKIVLNRDWVLETFELDGRHLSYQQIEGSFSQPNAGVNRQMLGWACQQAASLGGDLVELYCGNGNFTVALSPQFERVLATEVSKSSVAAANYNLAANQIQNVTLLRMSSDEISEALARNRPFERMKDIDLDSFRFTTLFVDPPRSGLDTTTLALAGSFENILYISCNPQTLQENVAVLQSTHQISAAAVFDQFPYTHHLECGLLLTRRIPQFFLQGNRHAPLSVSTSPGFPIITACATNRGIPEPATRFVSVDAQRLLIESAEAHGLQAWQEIKDISVSYSGEWASLVTRLQPVLIDASYRQRSQERLILSLR